MRKELLNKANFAWLLLSVVSFVVLTILMKVGIIGSYYSITLYNIFINIILAVSLNLVIGVCGQFSLGHAGFMCIGAYCAGIMVKMMPNMTGLVIGVLIGFVLSTIVALIVSIPTLRLKGDYLAIATLGFAEIVRILVQNMEITNGAAGLNGIPKLTTFPLLFVCAVISILVVCNFTHSAPGRADKGVGCGVQAGFRADFADAASIRCGDFDGQPRHRVLCEICRSLCPVL